MFELVTPPAAEVVSLADLKAWLRVDSSADDTLISTLGIVARQRAEDFTGRRFITQTWRLWLNGWPTEGGRGPWWDGVVEAPISVLNAAFKSYIDLLAAPVQSVSSVKYYLTDGTEVIIASTGVYRADLVSIPPRIVLEFGQIWPPAVLRTSQGVAVEFVAGYGSSGSSVPEAIAAAIKMIAAALYERRGDEEQPTGGQRGRDVFASGSSSPLPQLARELLDPYVVKRL